MSINVNRTTHSVTFNTGISNAEYNEQPVGQTLGNTQKPILPGSTTVTEALDSVFPKKATVWSQILGVMEDSGSSLELRTGAGFRNAAENAIGILEDKASPKALAAKSEIEKLIDDGELLAHYQASLLES